MVLRVDARVRTLVLGCGAVFALVACSAPGGTTPVGSPSATSVSATPTVASTAPLTSKKKMASVDLPAKFGDWDVPRTIMGRSGGWTTVYLNPDDESTVTVTVSAVPLTKAALDAVLINQQTSGPAICGNATEGRTACYLPLADGNVSLSAHLPMDQTMAFTRKLANALD